MHRVRTTLAHTRHANGDDRTQIDCRPNADRDPVTQHTETQQLNHCEASIAECRRGA